MSEVHCPNPTPKQRKAIIEELRKKHQPVFDALGIPDAVFMPKMAHYVKGLTGLQMGFFESELSSGEDVYTEMVSRQWEPEDTNRTLYKIRGNEHFREELESSEPNERGDCRYFFPCEELEEVRMPATTKAKAKAKTARVVESTPVSLPHEEINIPMDPDIDAPMDQMTLRDHAALTLREPVSLKPWLNDIIKQANSNIY